jgi:hypothetical protein
MERRKKKEEEEEEEGRKKHKEDKEKEAMDRIINKEQFFITQFLCFLQFFSNFLCFRCRRSCNVFRCLGIV